ncbi:N-acyl homoserine lactonase family protein [Lacisediminimonas profundi]|uniref:N-acyl homoserine lactonase family protein n=1 Tax=Lacisediminimonas profundi TaxID=2603856 RepID=UPI00124B8D1D|nr:N-acyl homoserine lactonase family protein [Lacisediminimonas profundi]
MNPRSWEVYAMRYATVQRRRLENFIAHDLHDAATSMDYYVWFLRSGDETILVDTGFDQKAADARKRTLLRCPIRSLQTAGIHLEDIKDTIITHAHYDHAGNTSLLKNTCFHMQEREMNYATGADMRHAFCRHSYDPHDVCELVYANFEGRVGFHDGEWELRPGITVHWVGGHTRGLQIVRVHTSRGWIVLASDASHYLDNLRQKSPFPIVMDVGDMLRGYELIEKLAESPDHIIAGHDPMTMKTYQASGPEGLEIVSLTNPLPSRA